MAEKTDEEIIKEVGLETSNDITPEEALEELSLDGDLEPVLEPVIDEVPNTNPDNNELKTKKNDSEDNSLNNSDENNQVEENEDSLPVQKKQPKIYKILMGIVAFLLLILFVGIVLYFMGFFDPEKPKEMPEKKVEMKKAKPEVEFDSKDLNKKRLNKKLTMLTKHEIMNRNELEAEEKRIKEEERLKKEAEEKALAEKKKKEEEKLAAQYAKIEKEKEILENQQKEIKEKQENFLRIQEEAAMKLEEKRAELLKELEEQRSMHKMTEPEPEPEELKEEIAAMEEVKEEEIVKEEKVIEKDTANTFLSFINVATIKGNLYKEFLDEVEKYDKSISLCRDYKNRIEIFFGPYDSNKERQKVFDNLLNNGFKEAYLIDFTNEEYQKRCKY